jgi:hypothetical protein
MARKPDKRVYVRRGRIRKKLNRRRAWTPVSSQRTYGLQRANLNLLREIQTELGAA